MAIWIVLFGFAILSIGLYVRSGGAKRWYLIKMRAMWGEVMRHGPIPLGICFIIAGIMMSDLVHKKIGEVGFWIVVIMFAASLVLSAWKPRWLKPRWLIWLEDNYPDLVETLLEEARQDTDTWQRQVRTQRGLEEWAMRIAAKYKETTAKGSEERKYHYKRII